jgi:hypothetical protein
MRSARQGQPHGVRVEANSRYPPKTGSELYREWQRARFDLRRNLWHFILVVLVFRDERRQRFLDPFSLPANFASDATGGLGGHLRRVDMALQPERGFTLNRPGQRSRGAPALWEQLIASALRFTWSRAKAEHSKEVH